MKAIVCENKGGPDVLKEVEKDTPVPAANEVLVKLESAGLNHVDIWVREGSAAYPVKFPHVLGADGAGTVEALGPEAEGVDVGDRVVILPGISCGSCAFCNAGVDTQCEQYQIIGTRRPGTYAEFVAVPDQNVVAIPESLGFEEAAAFPLAYVTAWHMLFGRAKLRTKENVLVVGAGSGVGTAAVQIAKWAGARVLAVTSHEGKKDRLLSAGAEAVTVWDGQSDFSKWTIKETSGQGAAVVVEHVGPATWKHSLKSVGCSGRLVTCGATTGPNADLDLRTVFSREITILGSRMGTQKEFQELCGPVFAGDIKPIIDKVYPLGEAAQAHAYLQAQEHVGKVVLKIR